MYKYLYHSNQVFMTRPYTKYPEIKVGDKFYFLEVISPPFFEQYPDGKKRKRIQCKCICGNIKVFRYDSFNDKDEKARPKSCGCKNRERNILNSQKRRSPESVYRYVYEQYKMGSKTRNIEFKLLKNDFNELIKKSCFYCGEEPPLKQPYRGNGYYIGVPTPYNGIDRIDSNVGYEKENCVPCCTRCNYMKSNMDVSTFTEHILKIANHVKKI